MEARNGVDSWKNLIQIQLEQLESLMRNAIQCDEEAFKLQRNMSHVVERSKAEQDENANLCSIAQTNFVSALSVFCEKLVALHQQLQGLPDETKRIDEVASALERLKKAIDNKSYPKDSRNFTVDNFYAYACYMKTFFENQSILTINSNRALLCEFKVEMFILTVLQTKIKVINLKRDGDEKNKDTIELLFQQFKRNFINIESEMKKARSERVIDTKVLEKLDLEINKCKDPFYEYVTLATSTGTLKRRLSSRKNNIDSNGSAFLTPEYSAIAHLFYLARYAKLKPRVLSAMSEIAHAFAQTMVDKNKQVYSEMNIELSEICANLADRDIETEMGEDQLRAFIDSNISTLALFFKTQYERSFQDHMLERFMADQQRLVEFDMTYQQPTERAIAVCRQYGKKDQLTDAEVCVEMHDEAHREYCKKQLKIWLNDHPADVELEFHQYLSERLIKGFASNVKLLARRNSDASSQPDERVGEPTSSSSHLSDEGSIRSPRGGVGFPEHVIEELTNYIGESRFAEAYASHITHHPGSASRSLSGVTSDLPVTTQRDRTASTWTQLLSSGSGRRQTVNASAVKEDATTEPAAPLPPTPVKKEAPRIIQGSVLGSSATLLPSAPQSRTLSTQRSASSQVDAHVDEELLAVWKRMGIRK